MLGEVGLISSENRAKHSYTQVPLASVCLKITQAIFSF